MIRRILNDLEKHRSYYLEFDYRKDLRITRCYHRTGSIKRTTALKEYGLAHVDLLARTVIQVRDFPKRWPFVVTNLLIRN